MTNIQAPTARRSAPKEYDCTCGSCKKPFVGKRSNAKYCVSCRDAGNVGPRVRAKLNTSIRIMRGVKLNLNLPIFKI